MFLARLSCFCARVEDIRIRLLWNCPTCLFQVMHCLMEPGCRPSVQPAAMKIELYTSESKSLSIPMYIRSGTFSC